MAASLQLNFKPLKPRLLHAKPASKTAPKFSSIRCSAATPSKSYTLTLLPGDGIGPEVISVAKNALQLVGSLEGIEFKFKEMPMGGAALDLTGVPLPEETLSAAKESDAVLLGAIGGYKWDNNEKHLKPETGLLQLRAGLQVFANLRPATVLPQLVDASTLKKEVAEGVDLMVVRELTGGIYFGKPRGFGKNENGEETGFNTEVYAANEIDRIARVAFETARKRRGKLCSVDKANVLERRVDEECDGGGGRRRRRGKRTMVVAEKKRTENNANMLTFSVIEWLVLQTQCGEGDVCIHFMLFLIFPIGQSTTNVNLLIECAALLCDNGQASMLWRKIVTNIASEFPDVELSHMYVDNAAMQLVRNPKQFDTIVTNNIFGDILSDEASMITGSIGMLPSASLGASGPGLFEPIHGSAPDIAGQDKANPLATVLSAAMLLKYGLGEEKAAQRIEAAVLDALDRGYRTGDIYSTGLKLVGCKEMGEEVLKSIDSKVAAAV
ncbi:hypothetical protein DH2020_045755 [Rehmannia glutinosa]|uniref:3-isopropylmalate dehydrogenase n=1 Tax=Rehmannia glutinosa TaxID=99300 RepID=A0ABR0UDF1_REHGL